MTQYAFVLAQANGLDNTCQHGIDPEWILLDSQSTISVFRNPNMLTNIRQSSQVLRAITNGGLQDSDMVGDFGNLGEVWFNQHSIANILSLVDVRKVCRVTMDTTAAELALLVHRVDGSITKFVEHSSGLYVFKGNSTNNNVTGYTLLSTVAEQRKMFSRSRDVKAADTARELYRKLGWPSEADFIISYLTKNSIQNCPVTPDDARRATIIYGAEVSAQKGKTTRSAAAPRTPTFVAQPIPAPILKHHRNVTICADFFFVQGLPFFHTISRTLATAPLTLSPTARAPPFYAGCATFSNDIPPDASPYATFMGTTSSSVHATNCSQSPSPLHQSTVMLARLSVPVAPLKSVYEPAPTVYRLVVCLAS